MNFGMNFYTADFYTAGFCIVYFYKAAKAYLSCLRNASTNSFTNYSVMLLWKNMFEKNQCQTL